MRVLVCGDRNWTDACAIEIELWKLPEGSTVIQGAAPGADSLAAMLAYRIGLQVEEYPAQWKQYGRAAGPIRNKKMLTEGRPDKVLAFHSDLPRSKGTRNMVELAEKAGIPVEVIER